jgi:hypothetical protein
LLASLRFGVEEVSWDQRFARPRIACERADFFTCRLANALADLKGFKVVGIAGTPAIAKAFARFTVAVIVVSGKGPIAGPHVTWKRTNLAYFASGWLGQQLRLDTTKAVCSEEDCTFFGTTGGVVATNVFWFVEAGIPVVRSGVGTIRLCLDDTS